MNTPHTRDLAKEREKHEREEPFSWERTCGFVISLESELAKTSMRSLVNLRLKEDAIQHWEAWSSNETSVALAVNAKLLPREYLSLRNEVHDHSAGNMISHLALWHRLSESRDQFSSCKHALVIEDDVAVMPNAAAWIDNQVAAMDGAFDFINLCAHRATGTHIRDSDCVSIDSTQDFPTNFPNIQTTAYVVSISMLRSLIDAFAGTSGWPSRKCTIDKVLNRVLYSMDSQGFRSSACPFTKSPFVHCGVLKTTGRHREDFCKAQFPNIYGLPSRSRRSSPDGCEKVLLPDD